MVPHLILGRKWPRQSMSPVSCASRMDFHIARRFITEYLCGLLALQAL
jgi:hypothetical protein